MNRIVIAPLRSRLCKLPSEPEIARVPLDQRGQSPLALLPLSLAVLFGCSGGFCPAIRPVHHLLPTAFQTGAGRGALWRLLPLAAPAGGLGAGDGQNEPQPILPVENRTIPTLDIEIPASGKIFVQDLTAFRRNIKLIAQCYKTSDNPPFWPSSL